MLKYIEQNIGFILVIAACVSSLFTFKDYGISWDEDTQRETGKLTHEYVLGLNQELLNWPDKDYGVAFEWPAYLIEKTLDLKDSRDIYIARHLLIHLFFLVGSFFCFLLIDLLYKNKWLASIGFLLFILHPRIYAHSFFNSKDISFLAMFMICLYLNAKAFNTKKLKHFIALGIAYGILINLRLMGVLLPFISFSLLLFDYLRTRKKRYLHYAITLSVLSLFTLYLSWPYLWNSPFNNFYDAFVNMSKFRWGGELMYKGELLKAYNLSWNYLPTWFSITTPITYLILGFYGVLLAFFIFIKNPIKFITDSFLRNQMVFLLGFLGPVLVVIALRSVLYDGWRQLYFIYPSFVMLMVYGLHHLFIKANKKLMIPIVSIAIGVVLVFIIKNHPHQQIYFNKIADTKTQEYLRKNYELDYWGSSYKQAYEYILLNDSSEIIKIMVANIPGTLNRMILTEQDRNRIQLVEDLKEADYFITNYRGHYKDYGELESKKWYSIKILNNSINTIYKLKM